MKCQDPKCTFRDFVYARQPACAAFRRSKRYAARTYLSFWIGSTNAPLGMRARTQARTHNKHDARTFPRCPLMGLGTGADRIASAVSRIQRPALRRRPPLTEQDRDQLPPYRDTQDGTPPGLKRRLSNRQILSQRRCIVLQLRHRHGTAGSPSPPTNRSSGVA